MSNENSGETESNSDSSAIFPVLIENEMKDSYLNYAMSVIVGRALPDARDGLKPVHRRILFAMNELNLASNKQTKKSARIVGEVLGKYHPHGDSAVYESMVRMAQDFALRYPLVHGQGNFGSIDGDNAAAMRYTEAKLTKLSEEMLLDINKNTIDFKDNFDATLKEPEVLPAGVPNLLINGSTGIAVGMATNIPPHNIGEIISATTTLIDNPEISIDELNKLVKGPDFPTGGIITQYSGVKSAYRSGKGKIKISARMHIETKKDRERIIVTEIPYAVNKSLLLEQIADLVRSKRIPDISDLRDESDRDGMRIVIELKKGANNQVVQNQLLKLSRLKTTFGINMLALVEGEPKLMSLKHILQVYIKHRQVVVRRRTQFEHDKAAKRAHILQGLIVALNSIDKAISIIKASKGTSEANEKLIATFNIDKIQSQAILDMKLQRLTSLEQDKIREEFNSLQKLMEKLKKILSDENEILKLIKTELNETKEKYMDNRKSEINESEDVDGGEIDDEELIDDITNVISITKGGYIKRLPTSTYKLQNRGGRGVMGQKSKDEDFVENVFIASARSYLLLLTNKGQVHWLKVYKIPESGRTAKGKAIINLASIGKDEHITTILPVKEFNADNYLLLATKNGIVKKTELSAYSKPRAGGIRAITLEEDDGVIKGAITDGNKQIILGTKSGMAVKFHEKDARPIGRTSKGVRGINLSKNDEVVGLIIGDDDKTIFTITENGYGKRTKIEDYRLTRRGGKGVKNIICSERNGKVVAVRTVESDDDLVIMSKGGIVIRIKASQISTIGRNTQGMRIMRLGEDDDVAAVAKIADEDQPEEEQK